MGSWQTDPVTATQAQIAPSVDADPWQNDPVSPIPKIPDTSGIQKMAQDNLTAANDNDSEVPTTPKPPQSPGQRLDTAMGMPVTGAFGGANPNTPLPADIRGHIVKAYANGTADNAGDYMQSAVPAVAHVSSGAGAYLMKSLVGWMIDNPNPLESAAQTIMKAPGQILSADAQAGEATVARLVAPFISSDAQSYLQQKGALPSPADFAPLPAGATSDQKLSQFSKAVLASPIGPYSNMVYSMFAPAAPLFEGAEKTAVAGGVGQGKIDAINAALALSTFLLHPAKPEEGITGNDGGSPPPPPPGSGGAQVLKEVVGQTIGKEPATVTPDDIYQTIHQGFKDRAPTAQDFHNVADLTGTNVSTLHTVYKETGVKPDQVFDDIRSSPGIASDIEVGKVPDAYSHLVEPKELATEKLSVAPSDTAKAFNVVDEQGDHVQGGFDSAEEARHYIEDKKFEAEERAAIEEENNKAPEENKQSVIPGAEKISDKNLVERIMDKVKRPIKEQKPADEGLFDTGAQKQTDLVDQANQSPAEPNLPKELSGAKPRYGYGSKQFTLKFESDIDRAAYTVSGKGESKAHAKYDAFLKEHGLTDSEIKRRGDAVRDRIKAIAKDAQPGELTVGKSEVTIPKEQKFLTNKTVPPSEIGKPTSLKTFIKNNGGIKADADEGGDLSSAGHKDLLKSNGKNIDAMGELAQQHGYFRERPDINELKDALINSDGGLTHFREVDVDRVAKMEAAKKARENLDPSKIAHEAAQVGLDTEKVAGETDSQHTARLLEALNDFYKNAEGSVQVRNAAGEWLLKEPIEAVEKFTGKLTGGAFQKIGEGYIKTFAPELMGDKALRADAYMAKYKTVLQEAENTFYRNSAKIKAAWDKVPSEERMQWLYDHETGRWNEDEDPDHARYQALLDATFDAEKKAIGADAEKGYKENYLPHEWEDPEGVAAFFHSEPMIKKYGKDGFTKASTFQLIQDGTRAGFKLKTDNPESMLTSRLLAGHNMIATMDLLKDMESNGLAKPATIFSVNKRIAKTETAIAEVEAKYKEAFEKKNPPAQSRAEGLPPAVSKSMQLFERRLNALQARLEDFKVEKESNKLEPEQTKELKDNGFKIIGPDSKVWHIDQQVGPLWKNAMEMKGLWENQGVTGSAYRGYMQAKAIWTQLKLGLSLFHPVHVAMINLASGIAGMAEHLIQGGKISDLALRDTGIDMGITGETLKGQDHPAIVARNTPPEARTPEQAEMVRRMNTGGLNPTMSARDTVHFKDNFNKAISGIGLNNLRLLGTAISLPGLVMKPFMEHWIPGMKAEIYLHRYQNALDRDPSLANDPGREGEMARQIAKDTDRTYGEMNNDVQFWNRNVRDSFNAAFISGGWKLAQIYNARGLLQPLKIAGKFLKTGEFSKDDVTYNMLHAYTYTALTLALGAAINTMLGNPIGTAKDDVWDVVKNLVAPQTGEKNPDGTPIRLNQPAFVKEGYNLAHEINTKGLISGSGSFLYHQTLIPGIVDTLNNRDFTGRELISDPTDLHQWASAGWDSISPISMSQYEKAENKGSDVGKVAGILGFPMAGAYINQTPFEQKVLAKYDEQNPPKGDVYSVKLKSELRAAMANGKADEIDAVQKRMKEEGMSSEDIAHAAKVYTKPFVDTAWNKLPLADQKKLIGSASEEERTRFKVQ